jgi:DNA-binding transcriptional ArsR family regulator
MSKASAFATPQARRAAPLFAALGDETRLLLVARLSANGPGSISALSQDAAVTRQAVTKHLAVLADAGLARGHRRGRERIWQLEPQRLSEAREYLDQISRQWDVALRSLETFLDGGARRSS